MDITVGMRIGDKEKLLKGNEEKNDDNINM